MAYMCSFMGFFVSGTCITTMVNRCCSLLCFSIYMHQCPVYMPIQNEGSVNYFVMWLPYFKVIYANNMKCSLKIIFIVLLVTWVILLHMWHIYAYTSLIYVTEKHDINVKCSRYICTKFASISPFIIRAM